MPLHPYLPYEKISMAPFAALCAELRSKEFFVCGELVNSVVDAAAVDILESLGMDRPAIARLAAEKDTVARRRRSAEAAAEAGLPGDRVAVFQWLVDWLGDPRRTTGIEEDREIASAQDVPPLDDAVAKVIDRDPEVAPNVELIAFAARGYPLFLRGEQDGDRLLFQPGSLALWEGFFSNRHRVVRGLNLLGTSAVETAMPPGGDWRVLELGGGLGSAAESLLERLGSRVRSYLFTDVAAGFLRRGEDRLRERFEDLALETARIDINRSFTEQNLHAGSFELIYAVNVLHLADDLPDCLGRIRELLVPGGQLVFCEGIRPLPDICIAAEFIFQLLPQFRSLQVHPDWRPKAAFLEGGHWREALRRAGYSKVIELPEIEPTARVYPNYFMAAFMAS